MKSCQPIGGSSYSQNAWKVNSQKLDFRFTEFSEGRPQETRLLSGGRHRRGAAQRQLFLRGHDDRRVCTLHSPQLRCRPLIERLLYGRRLDHQLAGVDEFGEPLLLLQGCIQVNRPHPVEGCPNAPPLTALLLDEPPELLTSCSAQGLLLRSHEQPTLPLQASGFEAVFFEVGEQLLFRVLLAGVELDQQSSPRVTHPEEGGVQAVEDVDVLDYGQHVVWLPQEGIQLPDECPG